jgi:hypothetical protein
MDFPGPVRSRGPDFYRVSEKIILPAGFNRFGLQQGLSGLLHMPDDV